MASKYIKQKFTNLKGSRQIQNHNEIYDIPLSLLIENAGKNNQDIGHLNTFRKLNLGTYAEFHFQYLQNVNSF